MSQITEYSNEPNRFSVKTTDIDFLTISDTTFKARIFQPVRDEDSPMLIDVHGGSWQSGSRTEGDILNEELASRGILVASIDFRIAPAHPYPSQVQDVNFGIRWWKANASRYGGYARTLGALGRSSGGHTAFLNALKPNDPRYRAIQLDQDPALDASLDYVIGTSPVLDSFSRYIYAKDNSLDRLVKGSMGYFINEKAMKEGSPQQILERQDFEYLPPALVIHGTADLNVPNIIPECFAESYKSRGGILQLELFENMPHSFVREPSKETTLAADIIEKFVLDHSM